MTINYTTLLGLAKPVTGTETGQWGDVVNDQITTLVEDAVANASSISVTAGNVTLTTTTGSANQARMSTLIITGSPGTTRNVVAPSQAKIYVVINQSNAAVVVKGSATTGVTIGAGQTAQIAWNGSDFVEIGNYVHGNFVVNGNLSVNGDSTLGDGGADTTTINGQFIAANSAISKATTLTTSVPALTWIKGQTYTDTGSAGGTTQTHAPFNLIGAPTLSTSNIVTYTNASTLYIAGAPTAGGSATITNPYSIYVAAGKSYFGNDLTVYGVTVGRGAAAVLSNTAFGNSALAANVSGGSSAAFGYNALTTNTSGSFNNAFGYEALKLNTTGTENAAFGWSVLQSNTTGQHNVGFGNGTLKNTTTGNQNTAIGSYALTTNTIAGNNVAVGFQSSYYNTTGTALVGVGLQSLYSNLTGINNTAVGMQSLYANTTASNNTAVGYQAGYSNTTGAANNYFGVQTGYTASTANGVTAFGHNALKDSTASDNTAFGYLALFKNTTGTSNTAVGGGGYGVDGAALQNNTTGSSNTAVGHRALQSNSTASNNTAVGYQAAYSNSTGTQNTALGTQALYSSTTPNANTAVGFQAAYSGTTGAANTVMGMQALQSATTAGNNVAIGYQASRNAASGDACVAIGVFALYDNTGNYNTAVGSGRVGIQRGALGYNTTGASNSAFGFEALLSNTTGSNNTAFGQQTLSANTTSSNNTAIGYQAGYSNTTGVQLVAIGRQAAFTHTTGSRNTAVGDQALYSTTSATDNAAFGTYALLSNSTGSINTAVGSQALYSNTTASYNTAIGYQAGYSGSNANFQYNTFVGYRAGYSANPSASSYGNVCIGASTGQNITTGYANTIVGAVGETGGDPAGSNLTTGIGNNFIGTMAGNAMTTGSQNTILGSYTGNQGGLDIRTSSNNIVLSDGDGNPQFIINGSNQSGLFGIPFSGWDSTRYRSLQFGNGTSARYFSLTQQYTAACAGALLWNAYGDGDNTFKYAITGDRAGMIQISSDAVTIYGAPSGTAGNTVAWSTLLGVQRDRTVVLQGSVQSTGTGITFPATENSSSNANTLDDYEEGTFTPTITGTTTNPVLSYSTQSGAYTKIGNRVFFNILIVVTAVTSQGTGGITISGLPFAEGGSNYEFVCPIGYNDIFDTAFPSGYVNGSGIAIIPSGVTQANAQWGTPASATTSPLSTGYFTIAGFYLV